jgi:hypothetical protein
MYLQLPNWVYMFIILYCATWCFVLGQRPNCEKIFFSRIFTLFPYPLSFYYCSTRKPHQPSLINRITRYGYNVPKGSLTPFFFVWVYWFIKANSHMPCRASPMPCSESAVSFVKVRVVAGNIRTLSPTF